MKISAQITADRKRKHKVYRKKRERKKGKENGLDVGWTAGKEKKKPANLTREKCRKISQVQDDACNFRQVACVLPSSHVRQEARVDITPVSKSQLPQSLGYYTLKRQLRHQLHTLKGFIFHILAQEFLNNWSIPKRESAWICEYFNAKRCELCSMTW